MLMGFLYILLTGKLKMPSLACLPAVCELGCSEVGGSYSGDYKITRQDFVVGYTLYMYSPT